MALADLVARLERDAAAEVQAIVARTDAEVEGVRAAAERAVAGKVAAELDRRRAARTVDRERALALARRNARAAELAEQHAFIARVLERARQLTIDAGANAEYLRALPLHLDEALSYVQGLQLRVRCQARTRDALSATLARTERVAVVLDESVGPGLVVEAADGSVIVDNTLKARLTRIEPALAVALLKELEHARV